MKMKQTEGRDHTVDAFKGVLILLVVIGHATTGIVHEMIYLFHMPLFFMVSGYLLKEESALSRHYIASLARRLLIPYFIYLSFDILVLQHHLSIKGCVEILYGGRHAPGVYWYITCYMAALVLFILIKNKLQRRHRIMLIAFLGIIATVESNLTERSHFLIKPGIPLNLDVALMAVVYIAIGHECKKQINSLREKSIHDLPFTIGALVLIVVFAFIVYEQNVFHFSIDMKYVNYKECILSVLLPIAFGILILRMICGMGWLVHSTVALFRDVSHFFYCLLAGLGQMSLAVMYWHLLVNHFQLRFHYGALVYCLIGVTVPVVLCQLLGRSRAFQLALGFKAVDMKKLWNDTRS